MSNRDFSGSIAIAASDYNKEKDYWLGKMAGELQKSCFPQDHLKPGAKGLKREVKDAETAKLAGESFRGETLTQLMKLSRNSDYVLHMIFTGGVAALLYKYTGNQDIILGIPIYKQEKEAEFLNTVLPLRIQLDDAMNFKELLIQVRKTMVEANENQNYPIETLLFQLNIPFSGGEFPLFDVGVLLENIHEKKYILHTHPNVIFSFLRTHDAVEGEVEYNPSVYDKNTMERINRHLTCMIEKAIVHLEEPISRIDILSTEEKRQLLVDFNAGRRDYPAEKSIDLLFEEQAARTPAQIALTYEGEPMIYQQLNKEADELAANLRYRGVEIEEPVALMVNNSYQVVVGILGILKAGGAYVPLNTEYPLERKKYILNDCNAGRLLTNETGSCDYTPGLDVIRLENDPVSRVQTTGGISREHNGDNLAYIMYTSGSTGTPKGVMVEHRSAVRLVKNTNFIEFKEDDSILLTGALEFDASTFEIWGALLNGLTLHLVHKDTILNHDLLKQAITTRGVTTMWMTAPLFNQMVDTDIEVFTGLKNLLVGGDLLSPAHINRVRKRFTGLTVINGYGPTENTTFSTTYRVEKEYRENIPIGKPISNSTAYILDPNRHLVPIGVPGELFVGGDGLSRGYLNNPGLTAEKFEHDIWDYLDKEQLSYIPDKKNLYRTGDLARWLPDGNIEFLGRRDNQVKIRGFRIEPGEIENHLLHLESIRDAVVVDRKTPEGEKYLCAYVVPASGRLENLDIMELRRMLTQQLPDYMVPAYFIPLDKIPLNSNGKVNRAALPAPEITDFGAAYAPPRNPLEEKFVEIWSEVLRIEKEKIGIDADFFELGGHSLKATILISKLHEAFHVKLPLAEIFRTPSIRELAGYIQALTGEQFVSIQPIEEKEYYDLSSAQKRLYILQEFKPDSIAYNIPRAYILEGNLHLEMWEGAFRKLIHRHESLRTSFRTVKEKAVQVIHKEIKFEIEFVDLDTDEGWESIGNKGQTPGATPDTYPSAVISHFWSGFIHPFDLSQAPLLRVRLIKINEEQHILLVDIHHIITDGTSMDLFIREFRALYGGEKLNPLRVQYKDFSEWQNGSIQREAMKEQEKYWLKKFKDKPQDLNLPLDYPRPLAPSFAGSTISFELSEQQSLSLKRLAADHGATLYMVLLAIYTILLARLSGHEDIVVGAPIAARRHADLERIIGMFVNPLALRNFPDGQKNFIQFLKEVKENTLNAFENQEYPFDELVSRLGITGDHTGNPLFQVVFAMQNMMETEAVYYFTADTGSLKLYPYRNDNPTSKFDLLLVAVEDSACIHMFLEYSTELFRKETAHKITRYYTEILTTILDNNHIKLKDINISHGLMELNPDILDLDSEEF